jgi:hypothetical protein
MATIIIAGANRGIGLQFALPRDDSVKVLSKNYFKCRSYTNVTGYGYRTT